MRTSIERLQPQQEIAVYESPLVSALIPYATQERDRHGREEWEASYA